MIRVRVKKLKMSFWESPDLSSGVDILSKAMVLKDFSRLVITSMNLWSIKQMVQLFNLDLYEIVNDFLHQDLRDLAFQDSIIIAYCLEKCFKLTVKGKFELNEHIEVPDKLIPSTFEEEANFLDSDTMVILKSHYTTNHRQLRKEFSNYSEDSMIHDSLIGFKIDTISKKDDSCVRKCPHQRLWS
jgi:hypothetical protein